MLVRGARIESFRGLHGLDIPIGPVTILIGRNGVGKTSVLEALGHRSSEEGESGRRFDEPPKITWYLGPASGESLEVLIGSVTDAHRFEEAVRQHLADHLLVRLDPDTGDARLAYDRFRALVDCDESGREATRRHVRHLLRAVPTGSPLSVLEQLDEPPDDTAFIDLDLLVPTGRVTTPSVISMFVTPDDISPMLFRHLRSIAEAFYRGADPDVDDALSALADGRMAPLTDRGLLLPILITWTALVNELAPAFLSRHGRIELVACDGPDRDLGLVRRLLDKVLSDAELAAEAEAALALLAAHDDAIDQHLEAVYVEAGQHSDVGFEFSRLGTGHRRWICATVDEAARLLIASAPAPTPALIRQTIESARLPDPSPPHDPTSLRLIDEPVGGLESRVHGEIVSWLRERVELRTREHLVMSTHSPSLLQAETQVGDLVLVGLTRAPGGRAETVLFGPRLIEEFRVSMGELGISASELLFLARGLVLVEGKDDYDVLSTLYGEALSRRGVFVYEVGGSDRDSIIRAFSHSAFEMLDIPTWVMLDGVPDESIAPELRFEANANAVRTIAGVREAIPRLRALPFAAPDIAFGLRPSRYRRAFRHAFGDTNTQAYAKWTRIKRSAEAKAWFESKVSAPDGKRTTFSQHVLPAVLSQIRLDRSGPEAASPWLESSMNRFFEEFDRLHAEGR